MDRISRAWEHAEAAFEGVKYGDFPYTKHLRDAHDILISVGIMDKDLRIATILHDNIEDTSDTVQLIEDLFGWRIAQLIWAVSDGPGKNRKERHANTYPKTSRIEDAIAVKLADRIANLRVSVGSILKQDKVDKFNMYLKEQHSFKKALRGADTSRNNNLAIQALWRMYDAQYELGIEHIGIKRENERAEQAQALHDTLSID